MIWDTGTVTIIFILLLLAFIFAGVPIAVSMGLTSVLIMLTPVINFNFGAIITNLFYAANSFTFLAFPFYLLIGRLMNRIGLTEEIFEFANSIVGHLRGGLGQVNVVASLIFSGISGLAVADVAGLGRIEYRAMRDQGYDKDVSLGITGTSSIIGPIMPPSVPVIVYAVLARESIGSMFIAGILPAFLLASVLMVYVYYIARKRGYKTSEGIDVSEVWRTFKIASPTIIIPAFIVVGILSGYFTATEAGAVALVYILVLGLIRRGLTLGDILDEFKAGLVETFSIVFIIAAAGLYGFVGIQLRIPIVLADAITGITTNATVLMLILMVIFIFLGTFMEKLSAMALLIPVLLPVATEIGVHPIHFGVVMVLSLMFGIITPPTGAAIFVLAKVTDAEVEEIIKALIPFYIPALIALVLVVIFPEISLALLEFI